MELKRYINILSRRIWVILITLIVTMVVVIIGTHFTTPIFQASTTLRIASSAGNQLSYYDYANIDRLMNTYIDIITSGPVLEELVKRLNLLKPPNVTAEILPNTELIKITVEDTDPKMAAKGANTLANILLTQSSQLYTGGELSSTDVLGKQLAIAKDSLDKTQQKYQELLIQTPAAPDEISIAQQTISLQQNTYATLLSQYEQASIRETMQANMVTIVEPAIVPQSPSKPRAVLNYGLGLVLGLMGGLGLAFLFENLDTTLYTLEEIESITKLAPLAKIPKANHRQIDISVDRTSQFAEAFRDLAVKIQLINHQPTNKVLLIMSEEPQQGKSTIVSNLAFALAESGKKVVAVDCDMRMPKLHRLFRLSNQYGLSDVLLRKAGLSKSLQKSQYKGVSVLTSGPLSDHPSKVLGSPSMAKLIERLCQKFDYVLLDAPALLSFADTEILAQDATSLILVVRRAHTTRESVQKASKFLAGFQEKLIYLVINQADHFRDYEYYQYRRKPEKKETEEIQYLERLGNYTNSRPRKVNPKETIMKQESHGCDSEE